MPENRQPYAHSGDDTCDSFGFPLYEDDSDTPLYANPRDLLIFVPDDSHEDHFEIAHHRTSSAPSARVGQQHRLKLQDRSGQYPAGHWVPRLDSRRWSFQEDKDQELYAVEQPRSCPSSPVHTTFSTSRRRVAATAEQHQERIGGLFHYRPNAADHELALLGDETRNGDNGGSGTKSHIWYRKMGRPAITQSINDLPPITKATLEERDNLGLGDPMAYVARHREEECNIGSPVVVGWHLGPTTEDPRLPTKELDRLFPTTHEAATTHLGLFPYDSDDEEVNFENEDNTASAVVEAGLDLSATAQDSHRGQKRKIDGEYQQQENNSQPQKRQKLATTKSSVARDPTSLPPSEG